MAKDDNQPASKKDVFEIVAEAAELILKAMEVMFRRQDDKYDKKYGTRFDTIEQQVTNIKSGQYEIKKAFQDIHINTPSRLEFNRLKAKVDHNHPTN